MSFSMQKQDFFQDYFSCRNAFLKKANSIKQIKKEQLSLVSFENAEVSLTTDVLWIGEPAAEKVIVLISGTHGVEGYCGSAIQQFFLQQIQLGEVRLPENTAILMIHALSPWAMYWARRCDENGVDLNRNFIDFARAPELPDEYPELLNVLTLQDRQLRAKKLQALQDRWGEKRYDEVFSQGQYYVSWAPFFGGLKPSTAHNNINSIIEHWQLENREIVVIDLHTGLGPFGFGELISDHPAGSEGEKYAKKLFSDAIAPTHNGQSSSVAKLGLMDYRWHILMRQRGCFLTLEFGTLGTESLFSVLLDEHLYWHNHKPKTQTEAGYQKTRAAMLKHFFPDDNLWQQAVLFKSWQVINRVLEFFDE